MAERRMFAKTIIDSDAFIDMPVTSRLLYYDLSMRADDDGFVNSPKKIMRMIGASETDLAVLVQRKFIIPFDDGIVVIKHWRIHNYIRKDMYHETKYKEHKASLELDENNAYRYVTDSSQVRNELVTNPSTQVRLGKDRLGEDTYRERRFTPPSLQEVTDYCDQRGNNVDPERFVNFYQSKNWMVGKNKMKDWKAAIITWEKRDQDKAKGKRTQTDEEFEEELRRFMEDDES